MGVMTELVGLESEGDFFAPASTDMIDGLVGQYRAIRSRIEQVAAMVTGETAGARWQSNPLCRCRAIYSEVQPDGQRQ